MFTDNFYDNAWNRILLFGFVSYWYCWDLFVRLVTFITRNVLKGILLHTLPEESFEIHAKFLK